MTLWWLAAAWAGVHVVTEGETIESILEQLGAPERAEAVRVENRLGPGDQPWVGTILQLPPDLATGDCQPSYVWYHTGTGSIVLPGTTAERPLVDWVPVRRGTQVCSHDASFATLRLAQTVGSPVFDDVTLMPGTCLIVEDTSAHEQVRTSVLTLRRGSVRVPELRGGAGTVVVHTAAGLTVGQAGSFRVSVEPDAARTEAVGGEVLTIAQGVSVPLPAGTGGRTRVGERPGAPVALPARGTPLEPADQQILARPEFRWEETPGVLGYVVEFSRRRDFTDIIRQVTVESLAWRPADLALPVASGKVYWHIIGYDRAGYLGVPSPPWVIQLPE